VCACVVHGLKIDRLYEAYARIIRFNYDGIEWIKIRKFSDSVMLDYTLAHRLDDAPASMLSYIAEIAPGFRSAARETMRRLYGEE
jgi:hypothetical protein